MGNAISCDEGVSRDVSELNGHQDDGLEAPVSGGCRNHWRLHRQFHVVRPSQESIDGLCDAVMAHRGGSAGRGGLDTTNAVGTFLLSSSRNDTILSFTTAAKRDCEASIVAACNSSEKQILSKISAAFETEWASVLGPSAEICAAEDRVEMILLQLLPQMEDATKASLEQLMTAVSDAELRLLNSTVRGTQRIGASGGSSACGDAREVTVRNRIKLSLQAELEKSTVSLRRVTADLFRKFASSVCECHKEDHLYLRRAVLSQLLNPIRRRNIDALERTGEPVTDADVCVFPKRDVLWHLLDELLAFVDVAKVAEDAAVLHYVSQHLLSLNGATTASPLRMRLTTGRAGLHARRLLARHDGALAVWNDFQQTVPASAGEHQQKNDNNANALQLRSDAGNGAVGDGGGYLPQRVSAEDDDHLKYANVVLDTPEHIQTLLATRERQVVALIDTLRSFAPLPPMACTLSNCTGTQMVVFDDDDDEDTDGGDKGATAAGPQAGNGSTEGDGKSDDRHPAHEGDEGGSANEGVVNHSQEARPSFAGRFKGHSCPFKAVNRTTGEVRIGVYCRISTEVTQLLSFLCRRANGTTEFVSGSEVLVRRQQQVVHEPQPQQIDDDGVRTDSTEVVKQDPKTSNNREDAADPDGSNRNTRDCWVNLASNVTYDTVIPH